LLLVAGLTLYRFAAPDTAAALSPGERGAALATEVDGDAVMAATGALAPGPELPTLFDYVLSNARSLDRAALNQDLLRAIGDRLPPSARLQVLDLFRRTLDYRARLSGEARAHAAQSLTERWAWARRVRARFFSPPEIQALFSVSDRLDHLALERLAVIENMALDANERQRRLAGLEQQLPEPIRQMRAQTRLPLQLARAERLLLRRQGGAAALLRLRQQWVGNVAAQRLAALDQERQVWLRRVADYRAARQILAATPGLTGGALQSALDDLGANLFTPNERLRLAAYIVAAD